MSLIDKICDKHRPALKKYIDDFGIIGVAIVNSDRRIVEYNQRFAEMVNRDNSLADMTIDDLMASSAGTPLSVPPPDMAWNANLSLTRGDPWNNECLFYLFHDSDFLVLFAGHPKHPDEKYLTELARLNAELTDLTRQLRKKHTELERANMKIAELARTDPLTGLANRRSFREMFQTELALALRHRIPFSLAMADLDLFKDVNDNFGHSVGDKALVFFAKLLKETCRRTDLPARCGGDEFIIMMPNTTARQGQELAERIRSRAESRAWPGLDNPVTISVGVTQFRDDDNADSLATRTDEALYRAKSMGRNRVVIF